MNKNQAKYHTKTKEEIEAEVQESIEAFRAYNRGEDTLVTHTVVLTEPSSAAIRERLNLSQMAFAALLGVSPRTVQEWEQGRRKPSGPALALLRLVERHPEILLAAN